MLSQPPSHFSFANFFCHEVGRQRLGTFCIARTVCERGCGEGCKTRRVGERGRAEGALGHPAVRASLGAAPRVELFVQTISHGKFFHGASHENFHSVSQSASAPILPRHTGSSPTAIAAESETLDGLTRKVRQTFCNTPRVGERGRAEGALGHPAVKASLGAAPRVELFVQSISHANLFHGASHENFHSFSQSASAPILPRRTGSSPTAIHRGASTLLFDTEKRRKAVAEKLSSPSQGASEK